MLQRRQGAAALVQTGVLANVQQRIKELLMKRTARLVLNLVTAITLLALLVLQADSGAQAAPLAGGPTISQGSPITPAPSSAGAANGAGKNL
jgi:hypothetical protein